jgi:hypothetical protein
MLLKISSEGRPDIIEKESLGSLGKIEKDLENWMSKRLDLLLDNYQLWTIHQERPAKREADIIALDDQGNTFIFELKRGTADHKAVGQLFNYWTMIAKMKYEDLEQKAREYYQQNQLELRWEHRKEFNLTRPFEEKEFNQKSHLFVVAETSNENLWDMIKFLRGRFQIPIAFIKFDVYRLGTETIIHFDTSDATELLNEITGEAETQQEELYKDEERYFWYNTNSHNLEPEQHGKTFELKVAATYGPRIYGEKLARAEIGDHVFAYSNSEGIRAYGIVTGKWNGRKVGIDEQAVRSDRKEYHLPTEWKVVLSKEESIPPDVIRSFGYNNFRGTFRRIWNAKFARELKKLIESKG